MHIYNFFTQMQTELHTVWRGTNSHFPWLIGQPMTVLSTSTTRPEGAAPYERKQQSPSGALYDG